MRRALPAAVVTALALASPAAAGTGGIIFFGGPGVGHIRETITPIRIHGALTISYRGDPAAGCAAVGTCDYAGRITWKPPRGGELLLEEYGKGHRRAVAFISLDSASGFGGDNPPIAQVTRGTSGACDDPSNADATLLSLRSRGRTVAVGLRGLGLFGTRCAGPLDQDVRPALPSVDVRVGRLRRGRRTIDLRGTRRFSSHGFSGSVKSSLTLQLGRPRTDSGGPPGRPTRTRTVRTRYVTVRYAVEHLDGADPVGFAGLADPLCTPLDSCGASGSVRLSPNATKGSVTLVATAPARRPRRDLYAALGFARHGHRRGVDAYGFGTWRSQHGFAAETVSRADGSPPCRDATPITRGRLALSPKGGRMRAEWADEFGFPGVADPLRTRCPGPLSTDLDRSGTLASGSSPLRTFGRRRVVVRLDEGHHFSRDGYAGSSAPSLRLVLRRTSVRERVEVERIPVFPQ